MYKHTIEYIGIRSTMIERDDNIPAFDQLRAELAIAEKIAATTLPQHELVITPTTIKGVT